MAAIEKWTSKDGDTAGEESLDGADPRNGAVVAPRKKGACVVCLEDTEGVQQTPANSLVEGLRKPIAITYHELKNMKKPANTCSHATVPPSGIEGCAGIDW